MGKLSTNDKLYTESYTLESYTLENLYLKNILRAYKEVKEIEFWRKIYRRTGFEWYTNS
ncbi:hypothetical protein J2Z66_004490 [Paenibacillus eucommiae]|uniref:Uncharacterized protein n=1 Tax=Paenibacillus eucommiae TaxID=1355755 RepID=A0ABS4IZ60_9BACL|nr:hypothetical protein [Paenibacillus eucommiae]